MIEIRKRHRKRCKAAEYNRKFKKCGCSYWASGTLAGKPIRRQSLRTSSEERAQEIVRDWERRRTTEAAPPPLTIEDASAKFLGDLSARALNQTTIRKYRTMLKQLATFSSAKGITMLSQLDLDRLSEFRAGWQMGTRAAGKKLEHLRTFLKFAVDHGWVDVNPALNRPSRRADSKPAFVRSRSMARSNSANAPTLCIIMRPAGVVVSMASVRLRKPACASANRSKIARTSRSERESRSSLQTARISPARS